MVLLDHLLIPRRPQQSFHPKVHEVKVRFYTLFASDIERHNNRISVDSRGNSNSAFIAEGTFTYDEMMTAAKAQWPEVWARFKFEVREAGQ